MEGVELCGVDGCPSQKQESRPPDQKAPAQRVSLLGLFALADGLDWLLMLFGSVGACVHGAALPFFFVLFGRMIESLGTYSQHRRSVGAEVSQHALDLVYLGVIVFVSSWMGVAFWMQTGERQSARMRIKYLQSILNRDISYFDMEERDENIVFRISSDIVLVQDAISEKISHCLRYLSQFVFGFAVGFASVWQLTLLTLAVVPLIVIAGGAYAITMSTLSKKGEAAYAEAGKVAEEVISQVRTVYSFVGEEKAVKSYSDALNSALILGKKSGIAKGLGVGCTFGLLCCAWAFLLWYAGLLVRHQVTNGAKAFTTIINVIFSGFALGQAAPSIGGIAKGQAAASHIIRMIKMDANSLKKPDDGIILSEVSGQIEFCKVSFSYPSRPTTVFDELNVSISAGETCAIVGPSGSGKSTIISMVERFYEPISGQILLDGHDLRTLQLKWLRNQIGLVSQEPALFATSISKNILYGRQDADMDQIIAAAKASNAHSFIEALPEGYNTKVGDGGTQLSGGQKQRIAIARAVLRDPKILLLDEATSALDAESELIVQQALEKIMLGRTTIVIAHRLSTIKDANTIFVLKGGRVVESGTHLDLIAMQGEYAGLVNLQLLQKNDSKAQEFSSQLMDSPSRSNGTETIIKKTEVIAEENQHQLKGQLEQSRKVSKSSLKKLIQLNSPEWPYAVLGSLGAILAGMEGPLFAFGITHALTVFYSHDKQHIKHEIARLSIIFIGAALATVLTYLLQHFFFTLMGERVTTRVRLLMFTSMLRNEIGWFDQDKNRCGSLSSALASDATLVRSALADRLSIIVQNLSLTLTAFVIAFILNWQLAAVVIATLPLIVSASIAEQFFLKGFGGDYVQTYSRTTSIAREAIINIRTVASFNAEVQVATQFSHELKEPNKQALLRGHISGFAYGLTQFFAFGSYALGLWYASQLIKQKKSNFGDLMKAFMVLIITAFGVSETLGLAPDIVKGSQALGSVFSILERETEIDANDSNSDMAPEIQGDIELVNVCFSYPARPSITVLEGLSFQVKAGRSLAIVGTSGSGKSSVIALLMRFYDPTAGAILIDGRDIRGLNLRSLRLKIGLVQQEPALFSTTIYENIRYGKEEASEVEIMKAAKAANAHGFISRMPEGYHTQVGERGVQLSGGQKQRVAIARALLKDPTILLLDEATSALDTASEKVVQEALDTMMRGRTTVVVAHRLSTIRDVSKIVVLQHGKIVESGTHGELINGVNSVYCQLVSLQQKKQVEFPN